MEFYILTQELTKEEMAIVESFKKSLRFKKGLLTGKAPILSNLTSEVIGQRNTYQLDTFYGDFSISIDYYESISFLVTDNTGKTKGLYVSITKSTGEITHEVYEISSISSVSA